MRGLTATIVLSLAVCGSLAFTREKRAVDCQKEFQDYSTCGAQAASSIANINPNDASAIPKAGCGMIGQLLECSNKIDASCKAASGFDQMMNSSLDNLLMTLKNMPGWDESKCKAIQDFRNQGNSGAAEKVASVSLLAVVLARLMF